MYYIIEQNIQKVFRDNLIKNWKLGYKCSWTWDKRGKIVTPAWPPTTGTSTSLGSSPKTSACVESKSKREKTKIEINDRTGNRKQWSISRKQAQFYDLSLQHCILQSMVPSSVQSKWCTL